MNKKYFIGVDPGSASGAWAIIEAELGIVDVGLFEPPLSHFTNVIKAFQSYGSLQACIELVHSMPKQGVASSFSFGKSAGYWEGMFDALQIPYMFATPQAWQKAVVDTIPANAPLVKGEDIDAKMRRLAANRKQRKSAIVSYAIRQWPITAPTLSLAKNSGIADALCLAKYAQLNS